MIIKVKTLVFCENFMNKETFTQCKKYPMNRAAKNLQLSFFECRLPKPLLNILKDSFTNELF